MSTRTRFYVDVIGYLYPVEHKSTPTPSRRLGRYDSPTKGKTQRTQVASAPITKIPIAMSRSSPRWLH